MRLLLVVQVLAISFYGERHLVRPYNPTDGVTNFHVPSLSLAWPGRLLWSDRLILRMVWQSSMCCCRNVFYVTVGSFVCPSVCPSVRLYIRTYVISNVNLWCHQQKNWLLSRLLCKHNFTLMFKHASIFTTSVSPLKKLCRWLLRV